jgi:hypothetical protein
MKKIIKKNNEIEIPRQCKSCIDEFTCVTNNTFPCKPSYWENEFTYVQWSENGIKLTKEMPELKNSFALRNE